MYLHSKSESSSSKTTDGDILLTHVLKKTIFRKPKTIIRKNVSTPLLFFDLVSSGVVLPLRVSGGYESLMSFFHHSGQFVVLVYI